MSSNLYPPTSRYYGLDTVTLQVNGSEPILYLVRRFLPSPDSFALLQTYNVKQGDRLDNLTAQFMDDPLQFWRICDANCAMRPEDLVGTLGRVLRITLPAGIPGPTSNA